MFAVDGSVPLPHTSLDGEGAGEDGGVKGHDVPFDDGEHRFCLVRHRHPVRGRRSDRPGAVPEQEAAYYAAYDLAVQLEFGSC